MAHTVALMKNRFNDCPFIFCIDKVNAYPSDFGEFDPDECTFTPSPLTSIKSTLIGFGLTPEEGLAIQKLLANFIALYPHGSKIVEEVQFSIPLLGLQERILLMKYCVPLFRNYQSAFSIKDADEYLIKYNPEDKSFSDFLDLYTDKRIIVAIEDREKEIKDTTKFEPTVLRVEKTTIEAQLHNFDMGEELFHNVYPNVVLRLDRIPEKEYLTWLKEKQIPFFFSTLIRDWDTLHYLLGLGVTDVYIVEALAFELNKVREIAKDVNIRCFPNVAQGAVPASEAPFYSLDPIKDFFIRPEDVEYYEPYVDVLEIWGWEDSRASTIYNIYAHDKEWYGQLNEIILGLKSDIDSRFTLPNFAKYRIKCGKRCLKGSYCDICSRVEQLAATLGEKSLRFTEEATSTLDFSKEEDTSLE